MATKKYGVNELREMFLSFFESKGHLRLPSFSLIPQNDASLLLINSGMAPMKPYFKGEVTPLSTLDYLIGSFDSDIITLDYRVRGFTRDVSGKKLFIDHDITSIQDYIDAKILARYDAIDINVYQANLFHTNMLIKELDLQNYLFNVDANELPPQTRLDISSSLRREMIEIFSGRNIY